MNSVDGAARRLSDSVRAEEDLLLGLRLAGNRYLRCHGVGVDDLNDSHELATRNARTALRRDAGLPNEGAAVEETAIAEAMANAVTRAGLPPPDKQSPTLYQFARLVSEKKRLFGIPLPAAIADDVARITSQSETGSERK